MSGAQRAVRHSSDGSYEAERRFAVRIGTKNSGHSSLYDARRSVADWRLAVSLHLPGLGAVVRHCSGESDAACCLES